MPLVKLTEVCHNNTLTSHQNYTLREESRMQKLNEQGELPTGLKDSHQFTKLTINRGHTGTEIVVVGAPSFVENTLNSNKKLIKG